MLLKIRERITLKRGLLISYNIKRRTDKAKNQGYSTIFFVPKLGSDKVKPLLAGTFYESYILDTYLATKLCLGLVHVESRWIL